MVLNARKESVFLQPGWEPSQAESKAGIPHLTFGPPDALAVQQSQPTWSMVRNDGNCTSATFGGPQATTLKAGQD